MPGGFLYHVDICDSMIKPWDDIPKNILKWCGKNCSGERGTDWDYVGGFNPTTWGFNDPLDAMAFKLRFVE